MNYSTAVMLINPKIRALKTIYQPDAPRADGKASMTAPRVIFKTLDPDIAKGDLVVVPSSTRHNFTVVLVDEVDVDVDFDSDVKIGWIVQKVSKEAFDNIAQEEGKWIETIKASEKRRKREELKKSMLDMYAADGVETLPIANMGTSPVEVVAIENKTE